MHQPCISLMDSCQTGPGSLGSSASTRFRISSSVQNQYSYSGFMSIHDLIQACKNIQKQECIPVGCVPSVAVAVEMGCLPQCMLGYMPSACWDTSRLWTEFLTHACENITFPQLLLWTVTRLSDPWFDPGLENYQIAKYICLGWHDENEIRVRELVKRE